MANKDDTPADLGKHQLRPVFEEHQYSTFTNQPLVDRSGDFITREAMEKAVQKLQADIKSGRTIRITKGSSENIHDIVGLVKGIRMEGDQVNIDGRFLKTELARCVEAIPDKTFSMSVGCKPGVLDKEGVSKIDEFEILNIGVFPKREKRENNENG